MNQDEIMANILLELQQMKEKLSEQDEVIQQLRKENIQLQEENKQLREENILLKQEIKKLKERSNKDSTNSSKPPSTDDGFKEKESKKDKNTDKKRGGQKGSTSNNLKKSDNPDKIEVLESSTCSKCNHSLLDVEVKSISKKQVFDIPPVKMKVTEFQQHSKVCPCCAKVNKPDFPDALNSYVQYGDNIKTFIAYLNTYQMVPYERITELVGDLTSHTMSSGTVYNILQDFHNKLDSFEKKTKEQLLKSAVINVDETGTNIGGKLHWSHVISTSVLTYYMIHAKRGSEAIDDMEILPFFDGIAVHDHWKAYNKYECTHSFCNAHILRELKGIAENENVIWANDMHTLLTSMNDYLYSMKENDKLSPSKGKIQQYYQRYDDICKAAEKYYPPPTEIPKTKRKPKQSKGKNLLDRMVEYKEGTLMFFINLLVPFTNNLAERDLRMLKVKEKISGCFASFKGAQMFNRIRGFISTMKKNNRSVLEELGNILKGEVYIHVLAGC